MIASVSFELSDELDSGMDWLVEEYDNYLLDNFGLKIIDPNSIEYEVVDMDKFGLFVLKYPEFIIKLI